MVAISHHLLYRIAYSHPSVKGYLWDGPDFVLNCPKAYSPTSEHLFHVINHTSDYCPPTAFIFLVVIVVIVVIVVTVNCQPSTVKLVSSWEKFYTKKFKREHLVPQTGRFLRNPVYRVGRMRGEGESDEKEIYNYTSVRDN